MRDEHIKALFAALDGEPRPEFISGLRRRLERDYAEPVRVLGHQHAEDDGSMLEFCDVADLKRPGRPHRRCAFLGVAGVAAAVIAIVTLVVRDRSNLVTVDAPPAAAPAVTALPAVEDVASRVRVTIPVANTADSIAVTDDAVWVSGWDSTTVSRIDVDTNDAVTVDVGFPGTHLAVGEGGVWVGVDGGHLLRLDADSAAVVATIDVRVPDDTGAEAPLPVTGAGAVWVQDLAQGRVSRVDPLTNTLTATVEVAATGFGKAGGMVVGGGLIWVNTCDGLVSIDPQTLTVSEPIALDGCGIAVGYTDGSVWVGLPGQRTARVDPVNRQVEAILEVGPADDAPFLATAEGAVWRPLTTATVARIDTATNTVTEILDLGRSGQVAGFAVGHGSLWAGDYRTQLVYRIDQ